jgi:phosphoheptose isomerase
MLSVNKKKFNIFFENYFINLQNTLCKIEKKYIYQAAQIIEKTIKSKNTIYVCGNGGSQSIANHYVCDYFKVLSYQTNLKVKINSLCSNSDLISAIANDISYDDIFLYQAERVLKKGDLLILISSSGNSKNIKKVLNFSKSKGVKSIGFCSFDGGYLKKNCTIPIYSKVRNYGISEDVNQILMHSIMHYIKLRNLKQNVKKPLI